MVGEEVHWFTGPLQASTQLCWGDGEIAILVRVECKTPECSYGEWPHPGIVGRSINFSFPSNNSVVLSVREKIWNGVNENTEVYAIDMGKYEQNRDATKLSASGNVVPQFLEFRTLVNY